MRMVKILLATALAASGSVALTATPVSAATPEVRKIGEEKAANVSLSGNARGHIIHEPGSTYIKVHFSTFQLGPDDYVTVSNPDGTEVHTYHGTRRDGDASTTLHGRPGFAAMSIDGDTAIVTRHGRGTVKIDGYWRGYTPEEVIAHNPGILSVCNTDARRDAVCYQNSHPTEYAKSRAVARLLISGGGLCTTWRVGNTNRMLTNKHCFSTQSEVQGSEMQFGYECATCGGNNPGPGTKVSGNQLIKVSTGGSGELDYTLYSVNNFETIQSFGTLYLETRAPVNGERIYIPGHGDGSPKRMSIYLDTQGGAECTVRSANYNSWNMSYSCDTSGGNSGSPVLSADHKVLALHHLGGCPNNQGARMHLIYDQIKDLIDNGSSSQDFSMSVSPSSGSVDPGGSVTATVATTTTNGAPQTVALSASGLPAGANATFSPSSVTSGGSATMTITTASGTPPGTYTVTITGTGTEVTRTTTYRLTVNGPAGCSGTNGDNVAIPDNTTVESPIGISGCSGNASSTATVEVHIAHTYIGDLVVSLVAPDGSSYTLHNRSGGGTDDINQTYTVNLSSEAANGTWRLRVQDAATYDTGTIDSWTLNLGGGGGPGPCAGDNADNVNIADNSTAESPIAISGCSGNASSTSKVEVHIVHTYIGDLVVTLVAPDGSTYTLHNRSGGGTNDINQTYTVDLSGEARNGTWRLRVQDAATYDTGYIDSWALTL